MIAILGLLIPIADANAMADPALAYETVEPARITLGESATLQVTSLDGPLEDIHLPTAPGLTFELIGRSQGFEFSNGKAIQAWYIRIRVTPRFVGVFSIPGLTPKSPTVGLEVVTADAPNPYAWHSQSPSPARAPMSKQSLPKGIQLKAGGAAFVQLVMPARTAFVGESVPVDIEVGVRPGIVTSLNGPPSLSVGDFTLNNLSKQPLRRDQLIEGSPFVVMTWHSALAAVKPGDFSLSVETPLSVITATGPAADWAFAARLGWPFSQILVNSRVKPKDVTVASPSSELKVLPLPIQGRPRDFSGAVGDFQVWSDTSATQVMAGDPLTLRLHISGVGNFDRVDASMLDHLDHWKAYPPKSSFTASGAAGNKGEKVFEQPLIAELPGEQSIPALEFSYFDPGAQRYERVHTQPIKVTVTASLADSSFSAPAAQGPGGRSAQGLRPDHPLRQNRLSELRPLYFRAPFLAVPAVLTLMLAGSLLAVRPQPARGASKAAAHALALLEAAARSGDASSFFDNARNVLLRTFADRWHMPADEITLTELKARLGAAGEDVGRLFALADEARYSPYESADTDFKRWLALIRGQLSGGTK